MNKILLFVIFPLLLLSCYDKTVRLSVITDDLSIIQSVNSFNSKNPDIKADVDYQKIKNGTVKNLTDFLKTLKNKNYDIAVFRLNSSAPLKKNLFANLKSYSRILSAQNDLYYGLFYKYSALNDYKLSLYSVDFPVIITRDESLSGKKLDGSLTVDGFVNVSKKFNVYEPDTRLNRIRLGFTPSLSALDEVDYYFIFNSRIINQNSRYSFDTNESKKAFDFYYNFDKYYNFGNDVRNTYIDRMKNIDKKYYLKDGVDSADFMRISSALSYPGDGYRIYLVDGMKYIGLSQKVTGILEKSRHKRQAGIFIDYLLSFDSQKMIYDETSLKPYFYENINIPVIKNIVQDSKLIGNAAELQNYISGLNAVDFINDRVKNSFFSQFKNMRENFGKIEMPQDGFLENFSKGLN